MTNVRYLQNQKRISHAFTYKQPNNIVASLAYTLFIILSFGFAYVVIGLGPEDSRPDIFLNFVKFGFAIFFSFALYDPLTYMIYKLKKKSNTLTVNLSIIVPKSASLEEISIEGGKISNSSFNQNLVLPKNFNLREYLLRRRISLNRVLLDQEKKYSEYIINDFKVDLNGDNIVIKIEDQSVSIPLIIFKKYARIGKIATFLKE